MKKENEVTNSPPITRYIGEAERTLQALLQRQLQKAGLSFPQWVALTILSGAPLTREGLAEAIADARLVLPGSEMSVVDDLVANDFVAMGQTLTITRNGFDLFQPLRDNVRGITSSLLADVPGDDLTIARRVLETLTGRAAELLRMEATGAAEPV